MFTKPPRARPYSAAYVLCRMRNSRTASCDGVARGRPVYVCTLSTPSTCTSVLSSCWPPKERRGAAAAPPATARALEGPPPPLSTPGHAPLGRLTKTTQIPPHVGRG